MYVFLNSLFGLLIGSFIAASTYRYQKKINFIHGRSFCDKCKKDLNWYDNIPVLSYLFYFGRSRCCKKKISLRYPLIELTCAIAFYFIGFNLFNLALFLILFSIFIIDFESQIIPDELVFIGLFLSLINMTSISNLLAGFIASSFLLFIHLITKGRGMGLGDVKFAILGGAIVGIRLMPVWLFVSFLTGAIIGIILILGKKAKLKQKIAFGPFLIIAIYITLLYGEKIFTSIYIN